MKKTLLIFAAMVFALTACEKSTYVDGTYKVSFDGPDTHSWTAFLEVTIADDQITEADFDYLDADGNRKSEDAAYQERMEPVAGTGPADFCPGLEAAIMDATIVPDAGTIDVWSGATGSSGDAQTLFEAVLDMAMEGDVTEKTIPQTDVEE